MNATPSRRRDWRRSKANAKNKRVIAVVATLVVFGGIVAVNQVSNAAENRRRQAQAAQCSPSAAPPASASPSAEAAAPTGTPDPNAPGTPNPDNPAAAYHDHGSIQHPGDGQEPASAETRRRGGNQGNPNCTPSGSPSAGAPANPGLDILGNDCEGSGLEAHDGFQNGNRCVATAFGEVADAANNASLVITQAPQRVRPNQQFTLRVSTRNLVRDRFLAAGQGGYYKESAFLTDEGLVRGHFHTACRMLDSRRNAPDPEPVPAFFVATEDSQGGARPDEVIITVPGLPQRGTAQCASWAGDNSHRIPMMARANQIPAFDSVRITVR
nr:Pecanex-like protein 1 [Micromonospora sp. DSM 115978]